MVDKLPTVERSETAQPSGRVLQYGAHFQQYAASQNIMGEIGSRVAQTASQQLAQIWGTQAGQKPHGNLFPAITDFDKHLEASYKAQSQAVLSLQAEKLISDQQIQLAGTPRLTPELIQSTNAQVSQGLSRIAAQAPSGVKEKLQADFASQMISNNQQYQKHMISQQREDQRDNLLAGLDLQNKNALNSGSKNYADQAKDMAIAGHDSHLLSAQEKQKYIDSTEQSYLNGKAIKEAVAAKDANNLAEWSKNYAKNPDKLPLDKFQGTISAVNTQIGYLNSLTNQSDQLEAARMRNMIASDAKGITDGNWNDFEARISNPQVVEQVRHAYIQAIKAANKTQKDTQDLIAGFSNPDVMARSSPKDINAAFDTLVGRAVETAQKRGIPLTKEQAEVQVANSAGGKVPAFQHSLENKLSSGNPQQIESAAQQIHDLQEMEGGHALNGIDQKSLAAAAKYDSLRASMQPTDAAREMNTAIYNQESTFQKQVKEKWSNILSQASKSGDTNQFAFNIVGINDSIFGKSSNFVNAGSKNMIAAQIWENFNTNFTNTGGDLEVAKKLTRQFYKDNYGQSYVNGGDPIETLHPIEKVLGYKTQDVVPYIQQDVIDHLNERFEPIKKAYLEGQAHEYWEVMPHEKEPPNAISGSSQTYKPVKVKRHMRKEGKDVTNEFSVVLQGNAFDSWDVAVNSDSGLRNLFQIAPYLGITTYQPDKAFIDNAYGKDHH